eukprot:TRINITY_DN23910_c0_g4_i1.p1 TRINITY_DN23910_c0_g4~~TRINITY_DN23910_c0_g4_i1.p1  ORF type:complete len:760 (-),score=122.86 TRINITY_DN23910_c0_g4_i1:198-2351(-)
MATAQSAAASDESRRPSRQAEQRLDDTVGDSKAARGTDDGGELGSGGHGSMNGEDDGKAGEAAGTGAAEGTSLPATSPRIFGTVGAGRLQQVQRHRFLVDQLMEAIIQDNRVEIESLINQGASLLPHYYSQRLEAKSKVSAVASGRFTARGPKTGMVNPVDWATLEKRPRAALQILELGDGRVIFDRDESKSYLDKVDLARHCRRAVNLAAFHGYKELLVGLLARGAFVGQKNSLGESALLASVRAGKPGIADILLEHGAWREEEQKRAVLQLAASHDMPAVLRWGDMPVSDVKPQPWDRLVQEFQIAENCDQRSLRLTQLLEEAQGHDPLHSLVALDGWWQAVKAANSNAPSPKTWGVDDPWPPAPSPRSNARTWPISPQSEAFSSPAAAARGWDGNCSRELTAEVKDGSTMSTVIPVLQQTLSSGFGSNVASPRTPSSNPVGWTQDRVATQIDKKTMSAVRRSFETAIRHGKVSVVRTLLHEGILVNVRFDLGYGEWGNCLDWTVVKELPTQAVELLDLADEVNLGEFFSQQARAGFFWAIVQGYTEVLQGLLRRGCNVSQRHNVWSSGDSGLDLAVFGSRAPELEELMQYGAWKLETKERQEELLRWSRCRPTILEVFRRAGIVTDRPPQPAYLREANEGWLHADGTQFVTNQHAFDPTLPAGSAKGGMSPGSCTRQVSERARALGAHQPWGPRGTPSPVTPRQQPRRLLASGE